MESTQSFKKIKVLIAPLDWGMGHASRCIPIVNQLLKNGCQVWLAGEGDTLLLLRKEFPALSTVSLSGYNVSYQRAKKKFSLKILAQLPKIISAVYRENRWLQKFIEKQPMDLVISDNRFGLYTSKAHTVFISHQLGIKTGLGSLFDRIATSLNQRFIKKFDACWIPDFEGDDSLAGHLSHPAKIPANCRYIGTLSRFEKRSVKPGYNLVIVLSGPEPARSDFERKLLADLSHFDGTALLVRGTTKAPPVKVSNLMVVDLMTSPELNDALTAAEMIICRSGYTSVMDLIALQKKAILVPTPGQPEQEYLAQQLHHNNILYCVSENNFQLNFVLREATTFPYHFNKLKTPNLYRIFVNDLVKSIESKMPER